MRSFITIAGVEVPQPSTGLTMQISSTIEYARNANGEMVGQKIGRDRQDLGDLEWGYLQGEIWRAILQKVRDNPCVEVTYPDMVTGTWVTRTMLAGDREAMPLQPDPETGLPLGYAFCKLNLTDMGV